MPVRPAVALNGDHVESDHVPVTQAVFVLCREVSVDAPLDLVPFRTHMDSLRNGHARVRMHDNVAVIGENFLHGTGLGRRLQHEQHGQQGERSAAKIHGKSIRGANRSVAVSISK